MTVHSLPYFLNPDTPETGEPYRPFLEKKFGGPKQLEEIWQRVSAAGRSAGIEFAFDKIELRANTLSAHRLIHHAQSRVDANPTVTAALVEALFAAQFLEGRHIGDRTVLADVAAACGMDRDVTLRYLQSDVDAEAVRGGAVEAQRKGISGVPFFVFNNRLAASGAQPPEALLQVMREAGAAATT